MTKQTWLAMFVAFCVLIVVIGAMPLIVSMPQKQGDPLMRIVMLALSGLAYLGAISLALTKLRTTRDATPPSRFLANTQLVMSLGEAPTIIGLVGMWTGSIERSIFIFLPVMTLVVWLALVLPAGLQYWSEG